MAEKQPVSVKTGEFYQPVRIYYQVFKLKTVQAALRKLKCIEPKQRLRPMSWS
jgi:hypothetical protein